MKKTYITLSLCLFALLQQTLAQSLTGKLNDQEPKTLDGVLRYSKPKTAVWRKRLWQKLTVLLRF